MLKSNDVESRGTVQINIKDDGIEVNIFPLHVVDQPTATAYAPINRLIEIKKGL